MMDAKATPLSWPPGWKRTPASQRAHGKFSGTTRVGTADGGSYTKTRDITIAEARDRLMLELKRMGIPDFSVIVSSNLTLRRDGLPFSDQRQPADPGVAVYWRDGTEERCMATDRYHRVEHNLAALAASIEAMRAIERHGGAEILNRAFVGMNALLPAPGQSSRDWQVILELQELLLPTLEDVERAYRRLRSAHHPDKGGSEHAFAELGQAYHDAKNFLLR